MKNFIKVVYIPILFLILMLFFSQTEFESLNQATNKYIQAFILALSLIVAITKPKVRLKLFFLAFLLLLVMVGFYLLQIQALANSLASIAVGMLFTISLTYLPELLKKGNIEKL